MLTSTTKNPADKDSLTIKQYYTIEAHKRFLDFTGIDGVYAKELSQLENDAQRIRSSYHKFADSQRSHENHKAAFVKLKLAHQHLLDCMSEYSHYIVAKAPAFDPNTKLFHENKIANATQIVTLYTSYFQLEADYAALKDQKNAIALKKQEKPVHVLRKIINEFHKEFDMFVKNSATFNQANLTKLTDKLTKLSTDYHEQMKVIDAINKQAIAAPPAPQAQTQTQSQAKVFAQDKNPMNISSGSTKSAPKIKNPLRAFSDVAQKGASLIAGAPVSAVKGAATASKTVARNVKSVVSSSKPEFNRDNLPIGAPNGVKAHDLILLKHEAVINSEYLDALQTKILALENKSKEAYTKKEKPLKILLTNFLNAARAYQTTLQHNQNNMSLAPDTASKKDAFLSTFDVYDKACLLPKQKSQSRAQLKQRMNDLDAEKKMIKRLSTIADTDNQKILFSAIDAYKIEIRKAREKISVAATVPEIEAIKLELNQMREAYKAAKATFDHGNKPHVSHVAVPGNSSTSTSEITDESSDSIIDTFTPVSIDEDSIYSDDEPQEEHSDNGADDFVEIDDEPDSESTGSSPLSGSSISSSSSPSQRHSPELVSAPHSPEADTAFEHVPIPAAADISILHTNEAVEAKVKLDQLEANAAKHRAEELNLKRKQAELENAISLAELHMLQRQETELEILKNERQLIATQSEQLRAATTIPARVSNVLPATHSANSALTTSAEAMVTNFAQEQDELLAKKAALQSERLHLENEKAAIAAERLAIQAERNAQPEPTAVLPAPSASQPAPAQPSAAAQPAIAATQPVPAHESQPASASVQSASEPAAKQPVPAHESQPASAFKQSTPVPAATQPMPAELEVQLEPSQPQKSFFARHWKKLLIATLVIAALLITAALVPAIIASSGAALPPAILLAAKAGMFFYNLLGMSIAAHIGGTAIGVAASVIPTAILVVGLGGLISGISNLFKKKTTATHTDADATDAANETHDVINIHEKSDDAALAKRVLNGLDAHRPMFHPATITQQALKPTPAPIPGQG